MALDKHRILNDLGSVMTQLQRADCGCMGKLFSNPNQHPNAPTMRSGSPTPSSCGAYNHGCCQGQRYHHTPCGGNNFSNNNHSCMGHCNPPKLYSDTYNYLNSNLMKPVVQEVYEDLKSLGPNNTITNDPLAFKMGLSAQGGSGGLANTPVMNPGAANSAAVNGMANQGFTAGMANQVAGMGPDIVSMMMSGGKSGAAATSPTSPMNQDATLQGQGANNYANANMGYNNPAQPAILGQGGAGSQFQQYAAQSNPSTGANMAPQHNVPHVGHNTGHHAAGIQKFNEMFPGVMQSGEGGLNFDPMSIAMQMNPANQQQIAMNAVHKAVMGSGNINGMKAPEIRAAPAVIPAPPQTVANTLPVENDYNQRMTVGNVKVTQQIPAQAYGTAKSMNHLTPVQYGSPTPSRRVIKAPAMNRQQVYNVNVSESLPYQQNDNPEEFAIPETIYVTEQDSDDIQTGNEPFEAATGRDDFNTLGQPIKLLPATTYHTPIAPLPQTLSPQANVKNTMSKTSLMGVKPGRSSSKAQLQKIYHQYKGSESYQDVRPPQGFIPEGKMAPVERVGDSSSRSMSPVGKALVRQVTGTSNGDAPPPPKIAPAAGERKGRNGIQDMKFTSYPISSGPSWSFHGTPTPRFTSRYYRISTAATTPCNRSTS